MTSANSKSLSGSGDDDDVAAAAEKDARALGQSESEGSEKIAEVAGSSGALYERGAARAREALDELPAGLSDVTAMGERLVLRGRQRLDRQVRRQPAEALLLAGAIGYLIGWATIR